MEALGRLINLDSLDRLGREPPPRPHADALAAKIGELKGIYRDLDSVDAIVLIRERFPELITAAEREKAPHAHR